LRKRKKEEEDDNDDEEALSPQINGESKRAYLYRPKHIHKLLTRRRDLIVF
jgi:hypothetical protein